MKKYTIMLLFLLLLFVLTGCESEQTKEIPALSEPAEVQLDLAKVTFDDIYTITVYSGEVIPYVEELTFPTDGVLGEIYVDLGETVTSGQILASLDTEKTLSSIQKLEEEIAYITAMGEFDDRMASAEIDIAKTELAKMLAERIGEKACKQKELQIQKLELSLEQTRQLRQLELKEKQNSLDKLYEESTKHQITAPFDGRIVYIGNIKKGGGIQRHTTFIVIADDNKVSLQAEPIPESSLKSADKVYARILDKDYPITYIPYDTDDYFSLVLSGREIKTLFSFDSYESAGSQDTFPQSGLFAAITILDSYKENVLTLPPNAIYQDQSGQYVYLMDNGKRIRKEITTGIITDTKAEILKGLKEGDVVYVKE